MAQVITNTTVWKQSGTFEHISDGGGKMYVTDGIPPGEPARDHVGPRPVELLLGALGGCLGVDIVSMLQKMRVEIRSFRITTTGERADEHPRVFKKIHMSFEIETEPSDPRKLLRALDLSATRYCSVFAMLARSAKLSYSLRHAGQEYPVVTADAGAESENV